MSLTPEDLITVTKTCSLKWQYVATRTREKKKAMVAAVERHRIDQNSPDENLTGISRLHTHKETKSLRASVNIRRFTRK